MIYGIVPIGGKGVRLGLPFPKELLPQKGFDYYNPVVNHTVSKMLEAGAGQIIFVHGSEYKKEIKEMYPQFKHVIQYNLGFSKVIAEAHNTIGKLSHNDIFIFGLPDSVYEGNPFIEMVGIGGVVCGLFKTMPEARVDRLSILDSQIFLVKSERSEDTTDYFWGVIKLDATAFIEMAVDSIKDSEVGSILNNFKNKRYVFAGQYLDLGTWASYNRY